MPEPPIKAAAELVTNTAPVSGAEPIVAINVAVVLTLTWLLWYSEFSLYLSTNRN